MLKRLVTTMVLTLVGCGSGARSIGPRRATLAQPPIARVTSDEEYATARGLYDALDASDRRRPPLRRLLLDWALGEMGREIGAERADSAFEILRDRVLGLWTSEELEASPDEPELGKLAADLETAFRRRGAHREVLTTLAVELTLASRDGAARRRWTEVIEWMRNDKRRLVRDLEAVVVSWPAACLVDALAKLYHEQETTSERPRQHGLSGDLADLLSSSEAQVGRDLARLYLRVWRTDEALASLEQLAGQPGDDPPLRNALGRYLGSSAGPLDAITLAALFARNPADRPVAQRICQEAARRFPGAAEPQLCIGEVAAQREQIQLAIQAFENARELAPGRRDAWEALARLRQARLAQLVSEEKVEVLESELKRVEQLHADAKRRFPSDSLQVTLAGSLLEVGRGYYNAGQVDRAVLYFNRSMAVEPTTAALERLAVIDLKRGRASDALRRLARAEALIKPRDRREALYWRAKLRSSMAEAHDLLGDRSSAEAARQQSAAGFYALLAVRGLSTDDAAEAEIERGKALYSLGDRTRALAAFEHAVDLVPDRGSSYADVLAFLVPRGEREAALDAFHRAIGRAEVSEYLKVYCSLWVIDLDRRTHQPEDARARAFLAGVSGTKWYHQLARWATGRSSDAELEAQAQTPAKRAEAYFYRAMVKLEQGDLAEARALWRKVLDTQMMVFFEYEMASYYLRHGGVPAPPAARPRRAAAATLGDGSI